MYYKGTIRSYDPEKKMGRIYITDLESEFEFHLDDLPNSTVLPSIGECVKCFVVQKSKIHTLNYIIRFDHNNATEMDTEKYLKAKLDRVRIRDKTEMNKNKLGNEKENHLNLIKNNLNAPLIEEFNLSDNLNEKVNNIELSESSILLDPVEISALDNEFIIRETENIDIPDKLKVHHSIDRFESRDSLISSTDYRKNIPEPVPIDLVPPFKSLEDNKPDNSIQRDDEQYTQSEFGTSGHDVDNLIYFTDEHQNSKGNSDIIFRSDLDNMRDEEIEFKIYQDSDEEEFRRESFHYDTVQAMQEMSRQAIKDDNQIISDVIKVKKKSLFNDLKNRILYSKYKSKSPREKKPPVKLNSWLFICVCIIPILILASYEGYKRYQNYVEDRETKARLYQIEQQQMIEEQRRKLGSLPTKILSDETLDELLGKERKNISDEK